MPRRVLQVFAPPDGGVADHVLRLTEGLGAHGWEVDVAAPEGSEFVPRLRATGAAVHELPFVRAPGPKDVVVARALRALDRAARYDIVHAHSAKAGGIVRAALPRRGRLVYTPHCFPFASGDVGGSAGQLVYRAAERLLLRRTGALVAASAWERDQALERIGADPALVRVIYYGTRDCGAAEPDPQVLAFAAGRPVAGMVAVLRPQKDPLTLVRAAALLRDEGRLGFCVVIVGNGALRDDVLAEIERLGLGADVTLLPFAGDVGAYLRAFDLFALPSLWESLPISIVEAMACGLPVVGTTVSGVPEAVADGVTGRVVAPGSPPEMAAALAQLMGDPAALERAGAAGRATWERQFRLAPMLQNVADLYAELAA